MDRNIIEKIIKHEMQKHDEISFAYLHGSFIEDRIYRDIDIAVFLRDLPKSPLEYELQIEVELIKLIGCIVDVRILNSSPLSFRYHVIKKGILLIVRDDDARAEFQEVTLSRYFDFALYRNMYLKETIGFGVQSR